MAKLKERHQKYFFEFRTVVRRDLLPHLTLSRWLTNKHFFPFHYWTRKYDFNTNKKIFKTYDVLEFFNYSKKWFKYRVFYKVHFLERFFKTFKPSKFYNIYYKAARIFYNYLPTSSFNYVYYFFNIRLDMILFRLGFCANFNAIDNLIKNGTFCINWSKIYTNFFFVNIGDFISADFVDEIITQYSFIFACKIFASVQLLLPFFFCVYQDFNFFFWTFFFFLKYYFLFAFSSISLFREIHSKHKIKFFKKKINKKKKKFFFWKFVFLKNIFGSNFLFYRFFYFFKFFNRFLLNFFFWFYCVYKNVLSAKNFKKKNFFFKIIKKKKKNHKQRYYFTTVFFVINILVKKTWFVDFRWSFLNSVNRRFFFLWKVQKYSFNSFLFSKLKAIFNYMFYYTCFLLQTFSFFFKFQITCSGVIGFCGILQGFWKNIFSLAIKKADTQAFTIFFWNKKLWSFYNNGSTNFFFTFLNESPLIWGAFNLSGNRVWGFGRLKMRRLRFFNKKLLHRKYVKFGRILWPILFHIKLKIYYGTSIAITRFHSFWHMRHLFLAGRMQFSPYFCVEFNYHLLLALIFTFFIFDDFLLFVRLFFFGLFLWLGYKSY